MIIPEGYCIYPIRTRSRLMNKRTLGEVLCSSTKFEKTSLSADVIQGCLIRIYTVAFRDFSIHLNIFNNFYVYIYETGFKYK